MSKREFFLAYMAKVSRLPWASDLDKVKKFAESVGAFLYSGQNVWDWHGPLAKQTWLELGGKASKFTAKALRELP